MLMKKGMTISITLIMAMLVALVIAFILISMFSTSMDKGGAGLTGSLNSTTGDKTGIVCSTHCATCCLANNKTYCDDNAPVGCGCPDTC